MLGAPHVALRALAVAVALAVPTIARGDVTVIYAPASPAAPLVARTMAADRAPDAREPSTVAPTAPPQPLAPAPTSSSQPPSPPQPLAPTTSAPPSALPPGRPIAAPAPTPVATLAPNACPAAVVIVRAVDGRGERASIPLLGCDGQPDAESLVALSVLARPRALTTPPTARELAEHANDPDHVGVGIRRVHPGLLERLRAIADRFPGHTIELVAGVRPDARSSSRHLLGLALDVRVVGASLDTVHAFVSRFDRTGVGLYPTGGFLHLDVRERSTHWVDESGPGEVPRIERLDAPRGTRVRAASRPASPPAATPSPASTIRRSPRAPVGDADHALDADAIADEIMRDLGAIPLPLGPR